MNIRDIERLIRKSIKQRKAEGIPVRVGSNAKCKGLCALDCLTGNYGDWANKADITLGVDFDWVMDFVNGVDGEKPQGIENEAAFRLGRKIRAEFVDVSEI